MTKQLPLTSGQLGALNVPVEFEVKLTLPVGVEAVPGEMSATVAVHVLAVLIVTEEGEQTIVVVVVRSVTVTTALPELPEWLVSPLKVAVRLWLPVPTTVGV